MAEDVREPAKAQIHQREGFKTAEARGGWRKGYRAGFAEGFGCACSLELPFFQKSRSVCAVTHVIDCTVRDQREHAGHRGRSCGSEIRFPSTVPFVIGMWNKSVWDHFGQGTGSDARRGLTILSLSSSILVGTSRSSVLPPEARFGRVFIATCVGALLLRDSILESTDQARWAAV